MKYFVGDFETTVFEGQNTTEVWDSAVVELFTEDVLLVLRLVAQFLSKQME